MDIDHKLSFIKRTIEHSVSIVHLDTCLNWLADLLKKNVIPLNVYEEIRSRITERYEILASHH